MWTIFEYPYNSRQSYLLNSPDYFKYFADFNKEGVIANLFLLCRYFRIMLKCTCFKLLENKWCHRILGEKRFTEIHLRLLKGDLLISEINVIGPEFQVLPEWDQLIPGMKQWGLNCPTYSCIEPVSVIQYYISNGNIEINGMYSCKTRNVVYCIPWQKC